MEVNNKLIIQYGTSVKPNSTKTLPISYKKFCTIVTSHVTSSSHNYVTWDYLGCSCTLSTVHMSANGVAQRYVTIGY